MQRNCLEKMCRMLAFVLAALAIGATGFSQGGVPLSAGNVSSVNQPRIHVGENVQCPNADWIVGELESSNNTFAEARDGSGNDRAWTTSMNLGYTFSANGEAHDHWTFGSRSATLTHQSTAKVVFLYRTDNPECKGTAEYDLDRQVAGSARNLEGSYGEAGAVASMATDIVMNCDGHPLGHVETKAPLVGQAIIASGDEDELCIQVSVQVRGVGGSGEVCFAKSSTSVSAFDVVDNHSVQRRVVDSTKLVITAADILHVKADGTLVKAAATGVVSGTVILEDEETECQGGGPAGPPELGGPSSR